MLQWGPMIFARRRVAFLVGVVAACAGLGAAAGCADTDPKYGPPEAIRGREINFGNNDTTSGGPVTTADSGGGMATGPRALFAPVRKIAQGKCTPCHDPNGTKTGNTLFVGTSEDDAYTIFKSKGYQDIAKPNSFYTKGAHSGPALAADDQTTVKAWADAENAGGGTPDSGGAPADAGGG